MPLIAISCGACIISCLRTLHASTLLWGPCQPLARVRILLPIRMQALKGFATLSSVSTCGYGMRSHVTKCLPECKHACHCLLPLEMPLPGLKRLLPSTRSHLHGVVLHCTHRRAYDCWPGMQSAPPFLSFSALPTFWYILAIQFLSQSSTRIEPLGGGVSNVARFTYSGLSPPWLPGWLAARQVADVLSQRFEVCMRL